MAFATHNLVILNGANGFANADGPRIGLINVPYGAGSGAGNSVIVPVTIGAGELPAGFSVFIGASADVTAYADTPTASGFSLHVLPRLAANTISAGSVNVLIVA